SGEELLVEREGNESVKVHIPWPIDGFGMPLIATGTLQQRERPYLLPVELARGKINQTRNQLADWQQVGLEVPDGVTAKLHEAVTLLTAAACGQDQPTNAA